ncbi:MAG: pentapeptide repeat-containing protein [Patescibacteria group bacterium]|nr:pentapeptide repeat-containing protein [Patescibacteria group bacterium]
MIFEIKSIYNTLLWSGEATSLRDAVDKAVILGASLDGASLVGASLDRASLVGARLDRARLDPIRNDFYSVLAAAPAEVPGLLAALREGRVDGSQYQGECACLVGTIANLRHEPHNSLTIDLHPDSTRPAEVWFLAIHQGDTPANNPISAITVGWAEQWLRDQGRNVPVHMPIYWRGDVAQLAKDLRAAGVDLVTLGAEAITTGGV